MVLTWSETCRTFSMPVRLPVFDLPPSEYHDSIPGRTALNPFFRSRCRCGSESRDRLLSARKSMRSGGTAASMVAMISSKRTPKLGSCQPTMGRFIRPSRKRRSSRICSVSRGWYSTAASMQKLHV